MYQSAKTLSFDTRAKLFYLMIAVCAISLGAYVLSVNLTVHHTLARQTLETQSSGLTTKLSELEFSAIALKNQVSLALAIAHGFEEVTSPIYVRRSEGRALTLR